MDSPFRRAVTDHHAAGNARFTAELRDEGKLGLFFRRDQIIPEAIPFYINVNNFYKGIQQTLHEALIGLQSNTRLSNTNYLDSVSASLASGCCLLAYLKLRSIALIECLDLPDFTILRMPRADKDIEVPAPYALAIQQLGVVCVANLQTKFRVYPCFPATGHKYGIPTNLSWNPNKYANSVEYARRLGMRFATVKLDVKRGTAWWLFRQSYVGRMFELKCTYPEVNFSKEMAIIHTLFLSGDEENPMNEIISFEGQTTVGDYGSLIRDPHAGIHVSSFEALS